MGVLGAVESYCTRMLEKLSEEEVMEEYNLQSSNVIEHLDTCMDIIIVPHLPRDSAVEFEVIACNDDGKIQPQRFMSQHADTVNQLVIFSHGSVLPDRLCFGAAHICFNETRNSASNINADEMFVQAFSALLSMLAENNLT